MGHLFTWFPTTSILDLAFHPTECPLKIRIQPFRKNSYHWVEQDMINHERVRENILGLSPPNEASRLSTTQDIIGLSLLTNIGYDPGPEDHSGCSIFAHMLFCRNNRANTHVDSDMCQGMIVLHQPGVQYTYRQESLTYFCCFCIGCAVSLRRGDSVISNPREPQALLDWMTIICR